MSNKIMKQLVNRFHKVKLNSIKQLLVLSMIMLLYDLKKSLVLSK